MTLELHETAAIRAVLRDEWDALQPRLTAIAQRVVRRREVAEDVVSATVVELIDRIDRGEDIRDPAAYLARGVRFRAIDVVRSKDGQAVVGSEVADDALASIADTRLGAMAVDDVDALAPVREAFGALSERHREVLRRTVIDDEPVRDVARDMGMSANAVAVLALRARRALRAELQAVLMERAGGECAVHARSKGRAAIAHVSRCDHCLEVRGGRGFGRWVFAVVPLLVGGGMAASSRASVAQAAVGTIVPKPLVAGIAVLGMTAATTVVVVASVAAFSPVQAPAATPMPAATTPATAAPTPSVPMTEPVPAPQPVAEDEQTTAPTAPTAPDAAPAPATPITTPSVSSPATPPETEAPAEPPPAEPAPRVDPTPVDPAPIDPPPVDPAPVEPPPVDPPPVEPPPVEPPPVEPPPVEVPTLTLAAQPTWAPTSPISVSTTFVVTGLVPGATYQVAAPAGLVATSVDGTLVDGAWVATADAVTFQVDAIDVAGICSAAHEVALTPTTTGQTPLIVTLPQLDDPTTCLVTLGP
ncbi:sigma-70 family RNA polymerase sigma factor [Agrococcus sp. SGAir0287]|uniref:sigma-70 family RNA polymerase sigma factor n=1 Tax=Agrococcus sp. SGAir0287 TaxID=2070347 RepID=UPI0010F7930B|nr:sigma-70 family RNA polymerase sigma factor [Agrococcus sp. SGAir0287]